MARKPKKYLEDTPELDWPLQPHHNDPELPKQQNMANPRDDDPDPFTPQEKDPP